jgi:hypothetical protein
MSHVDVVWVWVVHILLLRYLLRTTYVRLPCGCGGSFACVLSKAHSHWPYCASIRAGAGRDRDRGERIMYEREHYDYSYTATIKNIRVASSTSYRSAV